MQIGGIGVDIAEVGRFRTLVKQKKPYKLDKMFNRAEKEYCFSYRDPAPHFAGTFAAKEAVLKAQGDRSVPFDVIEIRRQREGKPDVWIRGRRSQVFLVSISHTRSLACAIALRKHV